jgi:hypothetical protein
MITRIKALGIRNSQWISDTSIPHNKHDLKFIDITDDEYSTCVTTTAKIHQFISDVQLYMAAEWNYQDYCETIDHYRQLDFQQLQALLKARVLILDINRVLLNLLASVRMYLDHTETSIKRRYGGASQNWVNFKQACSRAYDGLFSYRFLYKLRNYAQHCGLPLNSFSASVKEHPERAGEPYHELNFGLERDIALREYNWGKQLNPELALQPELIEVDQHVHLLMQSIRQINRVFAKDELASLQSDAAHIDQLAKRIGFTEADYELGVYELEVEQDEQGKTTKVLGFHGSRIPMDVVDAALSKDLERVLSLRLPI